MNGLGDGHKIAHDALVGYGYRATMGDLLFEQGNHGATGAQHVAEPDNSELSVAFLTQTLQHLFAQVLCGTHYVGGVHCLVRRDQHKFFNAVFPGSQGCVVSAKHIVFHCFGRTAFHQRHMLMGRCVENYLGPVGIEDLLQSLLIPNGSNLHVHSQEGAVLILQVILQFIGGVFCDVHDHQPFGMILGDLTAQLRADGATATCHQHGFITDKVGNSGIIQMHWLAAQQVFNFHLADGGRIAAAMLLIDSRYRVAQDMNTASGGGTQLQNLPTPLRRQVLDGHDHVCYRCIGQNLADLTDRTQYRNTMDTLVPFFLRVINNAVGLEAAIDVVVQFTEQGGTCGAAAYDSSIGLPRLVDTGDPATINTVDKTIGQHNQQRQRRSGQRTADPDGAHAHQQVDRGVQGEAKTHTAQQCQILTTLGVAP